MTAREAISNPLVLAAILAVIGYVLVRGRIAFAVGAFLASYGWAFNVNVGSVHMLPLFVATLAGTAVVAVLRKGKRVGQPLDDPRVRSCALIVALWMMWIAMRVEFTADPNQMAVFRLFLVHTVGPLLLILLFVDSIEDIRQLAWGFLLCEFPSAWASLFSKRTGAWGQQGIVMGLGENYLLFSFILCQAILLGLGLTLVMRKAVPKIFCLISIGLCAFTLMLTTARQSLIGLTAAVGYIFLAAGRKRGRALTIAAASAVVAAVGYAALLYTPTGDIVLQKWAKTPESALIREELWSRGWQAFLQHPNTGSGLFYMADDQTTAHNIYIDLLASEGLVGFLFFVVYAGFIISALGSRSLVTILPEGRIWKTTLTSIMIFDAVHSFGSGSIMSEPEVFWTPFLLLILVSLDSQSGVAPELELTDELAVRT
jgi:hypothetical protein